MKTLSTKVKLMVVGRFGLAAVCLFAPNLLLKMLGFPDRSTTARTFARMLGVRDLAMGLSLLATAGDATSHGKAIQIAGLVDVGDVLAISISGLKDPALRGAALKNLPFAGGSAAFSFLAAGEG